MGLTRSTTVRVRLVVEIHVINNFQSESTTLETAYEAARLAAMERIRAIAPTGARILSSQVEAVLVDAGVQAEDR